jgi:hypothetical protein
MTPFQLRALDGNVAHHGAIPPGIDRLLAELISENERLSAQLKEANAKLAQKEST